MVLCSSAVALLTACVPTPSINNYCYDIIYPFTEQSAVPLDSHVSLYSLQAEYDAPLRTESFALFETMSGNKVESTYSVDAEERVAHLIPNGDLKENTRYTVVGNIHTQSDNVFPSTTPSQTFVSHFRTQSDPTVLGYSVQEEGLIVLLSEPILEEDAARIQIDLPMGMNLGGEIVFDSVHPEHPHLLLFETDNTFSNTTVHVSGPALRAADSTCLYRDSNCPSTSGPKCWAPALSSCGCMSEGHPQLLKNKAAFGCSLPASRSSPT